MSQGSFPWDCNAGGDGDPGAAIWDTPYSSAEWRNVWSKLFGSNRAEGMVIPGYGGNLRVHEAGAGANMTVEVETGAIFSRGGIHESDAVVGLAITASDPVLPRLDRVVARLTVASQEIRFAVVTGVAASPPSPPALTNTAAVWEVDIAHVYVQGNILVIDDENIDDKRIFFNNGLQNTNLMGENLLINSEFFAYGMLSVASPTTSPPDYWGLVLTPSAIASATKLGQMSRGRAVQVTTNAANEGISQTIFVKPSTVYSIKGCYQVTSGDVGKVVITTNSGTPVTLTRELRRTGVNYEFTAFYTTEADATSLTLQLLNLNSGDVVQWGQFIITEGYDAGPFRQCHESLPLVHSPFRDSNWFNSAKGVSTYTIDLDSDFGALLLPGIRSIAIGLYSPTQAGITVKVLSVAGFTFGGAFYNYDFDGVSECRIGIDGNRQFTISVAAGTWNNAYVWVNAIET